MSRTLFLALNGLLGVTLLTAAPRDINDGTG